ncbi:hypothetical protein FRC00_003015 [Tulasnella sp. 408]|nr:hypothetical protein FRC00_003015 [Tulasnella sp. 408]
MVSYSVSISRRSDSPDIENMLNLLTKTRHLAPNVSASSFAPLEAHGLDDLVAFSDEEVNDEVAPRETDHYAFAVSVPSNGHDLPERRQPNELGKMTPDTTTELIQPPREDYYKYYEYYNFQIRTILNTLVANAPHELLSRPWIVRFLDPHYPLLVKGFDTSLEGALWMAVDSVQEIQEATGDNSLLDDAFDAIVSLWDALGLGALPDDII